MQTKNQYLQTLINQNGYHKLRKKDKSKLLDEYCRNTKANRKYVIRKIGSGKYLPKPKRLTPIRRKSSYNGEVVACLAQVWEIFDYSCGQRLKTSLETEVDRLRELGELNCSDNVAAKLKKISPRSIDIKLARQKEALLLKSKYSKPISPILYQKIPIKVFSEQDRINTGHIQIDLVEHCGSSAAGEYGHTLSTTDLATNWWEGEAILTKAQKFVHGAIERVRSRYPLKWNSLHSDNGREFINALIYGYSQTSNLEFTRSRPYRKNDNFLVEQKNSTHVRKTVGWLRYDTEAEIEIINDLYRNELRLYKNFFQPVIRLNSKTRVNGKVKRKYDKAKTPYQIIMEDDNIKTETKEKLTAIYLSLNPAELQRSIKAKLDMLTNIYQQKQNSQTVDKDKVLVPASVTFLNCTTNTISVT